MGERRGGDRNVDFCPRGTHEARRMTGKTRGTSISGSSKKSTVGERPKIEGTRIRGNKD